MAEGGENGATGYAVTVPANDRVEVRFPTTTAGAGTARFQFGAIDANQPSIADAAVVDLPVYTPATTEAFAVYGEIDESGAVMQPLRPPSAALPNYGGLEVTISSTALQALTDAFIYLVRYPYECSEQLASRILGVSALRDVLTAFEAEGLPSPAEIESTMERTCRHWRPCRTTAAASQSGVAGAKSGPITACMWPMRWPAPGRRATPYPKRC